MVRILNSISIDMVFIPKGSFYTDSKEPDNDLLIHYNFEKLATNSDGERFIPNVANKDKLVIDHGFKMGKYPITVSEYMHFVSETNSNAPEWLKQYPESYTDVKNHKQDNAPIIGISWENAIAYCKWLSSRTNKKYRLPTTKEWEYACRANTTSKWSFGDDEKKLDEYAWYGFNSDMTTHIVGQKKPNSWGLYDMHGNVWEWCTLDSVKDKNTQALCGGSWFSEPEKTYSNSIFENNNDVRDRYRGFRILCEIEESVDSHNNTKDVEDSSIKDDKNTNNNISSNTLELGYVDSEEVNKTIDGYEAIQVMREWFFTHYEDPANSLPYESKEGGYQTIHGELVDIEDVLYEEFEDTYSNDIIKKGIENITDQYGDMEWSPIPTDEEDFQNKLGDWAKRKSEEELNKNSSTSKSDITFQCEKCNTAYSTNCKELHWEQVSGSERNMGAELEYEAEYSETCHECDNEMSITFNCWEYPVGAENYRDVSSKGIINLEGDCCLEFNTSDEGYFEDGYVENGYVDPLETEMEDTKSVEVDIVSTTSEPVKTQEKQYASAGSNLQVAKNIELHLGMPLKNKTRTVFISSENDTAVCCLLSKTYDKKKYKYKYWYGFKRKQQVEIEGFENAYIAFGCGSPDKILLFEYKKFKNWLKNMYVTENEKDKYWHVEFYEDEHGNIELALKASVDNIDVTNNLLSL